MSDSSKKVKRETYVSPAVPAAAGAGLLLKSPGAIATTQNALLGGAILAPRGVDGRLTRIGEFDVESRHGFTIGFGAMQRELIRTAANAALDRVLEREGIDPAEKIDMTTLGRLIDDDPAIGISTRTFVANQRLTYANLQAYFHSHDNAYLSEMEATDRSGPGTLELAPTMHIPEHVSHQIHTQPGGYVGDPFAGHMYHYSTNSFWAARRGSNDQDEIHRNSVKNLPVPKDGKVRRILDYGCGIGQFTVGLKERFPDAEVWGLDIGAPMIRYGHMRASHLNYDVNFVQRLAEDNGFPDGYFDLVTSYIAHHEMPADVSRQVVAEAQRVTRPGGVYYPLDFKSLGTTMIPRSMFARWWDHRWNNEPWSLEFRGMDFDSEIQARGFDQVKTTKPVVRGFGNRHFIRT